ncbi:claudin-23-like [Pygocentrus nattereri]|uniref:Claudin 23a n=1 Tax=Pygocentrus nattereri TaxID=42514 RepID=A0A3B4CJN1_PYGNA|nr:claudin-23-like [Pygocentrus nattereri]
MRPSKLVMYGLVLAICGWILNLTSTTSPNWRTVRNITGEQPDLVLQQGIWDICWNIMKKGQKDLLCTRQDQDYFNSQIIEVAQWMTVASLGATVVGLIVVLGAHGWIEKMRWLIAGLGGFIVICSGVAAIIPTAWYAYLLTDIPSPSTNISLGHCIVLGCVGGFMEVLSGFIIFVGLCRGSCNQEHKERRENTAPDSIRNPFPFRKISKESNVPYVRDSLRDDDDAL